MRWSTTDSWINSRLGAWLSLSLGEEGVTPQDAVAVTFGPPGPEGRPAADVGRAKRGINLHLLTIAPHEHATAHIGRTTELQLSLRFLVTSWADASDAAEPLLCQLAFHLLGRGGYGPDGGSEVVLEPAPPLDVLVSLGLPRPALVMRLTLVHLNAPRPAPRVEHPPIVRAENATTLVGTLVAPSGAPIAAAQVSLPALGRTTETDEAGRFRFVSVSANPAGQTIRVRARNVEHTFQLSAGDRGPFALQMSFGEEG